MALTLQQLKQSITGSRQSVTGMFVYLTEVARACQWNFEKITQLLNTATSVYAYRTAVQTIANETDTTIVFTTEGRDALGEYDNSTGIFTAKTGGKYLVCVAMLSASVAWDAGEIFRLSISKNGLSTVGNYFCLDRWFSHAANTGLANTSGSIVVSLEPGDTIRVKCYHNRGANTDIYADSDGYYTWLTIQRML